MDVKLFANLAEHADTRTVEVSPPAEPTVRDVLGAVFAAHPELEGAVLTEAGEIQDHITILVDGTNVTHMDEGLDHAVDPSAEIALFPPVSGGS